jgi:hypothetical protein
MTTADIHVRIVRVPLPAGRVVRLALLGDELIIGNGYGSEDALTSIAHGVRIPAASWPGLAVAAGELLADADGER